MMTCPRRGVSAASVGHTKSKGSIIGTRALCRFGVYGRAGDSEREVLDLADAYRLELCNLYHEQHRAVLDLRERQFPGLFAAMVRREQISAAIFSIERAIKQHHTNVRDRNAVPVALGEQLRALRAARMDAKAEVTRLKTVWISVIKDALKLLGDSETRKNCKSLEAREALYGAIQWPLHLQDYGLLWIYFDLRRRRLSERYQSLGLHYAIRGEIDAASKPKLMKDGPGMRYSYHRQPEPRPWEKLTLQFGGGGLDVPDAFVGTRQFSIRPIYTNHPSGGDETVAEVTQQIGNSGHPRLITYRVKLDRPLPGDATIQRWTLIVRPNGKRECVPIISGLDFTKPMGAGTLSYDLSWTVAPNGVRVCRFSSEHVNETLVLPRWIVDSRMAVKPAQTLADNTANDLLLSRGESVSKVPGPHSLFGVSALAQYCESHRDDQAALNQLDQSRHDLRRAQRTADKARRCIEKIYETVAHRVCRLHDKIVPDPLPLTKLKRYDTRDLLREDVLPEKSREILFAVAPGKLRALLDGYGLASGEVTAENVVVARETDLFTSWVKSLGCKSGPKDGGKCRRSQHAPATVDLQ